MGRYSDHSVSVSRELDLWKTHTTLAVEVLNIANKNYEIVKNFPMPGRSFRASITLKY